jgi:DNA-binding MarR family transcriptional regulator
MFVLSDVTASIINILIVELTLMDIRCKEDVIRQRLTSQPKLIIILLTNQPNKVVIILKEENMHFIQLNSKIFRNIQIYLDRVLLKYELSSGALPYLFILEKKEGISQNKISEAIGNDKAMSARTITRLIELGYVYKMQDERDSRAYKLYLTAKAKDIMPQIHEEIQTLLSSITADLSDEEKQITLMSLRKIFNKTQGLRE